MLPSALHDQECCWTERLLDSGTMSMPPRFGRYWREEPNRWSRWLAARSTRSVVLVSVLLGCAVAALPWPHWWSRLLYGLIVGLMPYNGVKVAKIRLIMWKKRHPDSN
jgi:hypothetical protein